MQETLCLCAAFSWLGMQRQQAPGTGSQRNPHHTLQPLQTHTEDHPPPPQLSFWGQFLRNASRQTPTHKNATPVHRLTDNPNPEPVTNTYELAKNNSSQRGRRDKWVERQQAGHSRYRQATQRRRDSETKSKRGAGRETSVTPGKAVSASSLRQHEDSGCPRGRKTSFHLRHST